MKNIDWDKAEQEAKSIASLIIEREPALDTWQGMLHRRIEALLSTLDYFAPEVSARGRHRVEVCPVCKGHQEVDEFYDPCPNCNSTGKIPKSNKDNPEGLTD